MSTKQNRHGKHLDDKVQFGGMVSPEFKALAQLTASISKCSMMELMTKGINNIATEFGILKNGMVTPKYKEAIESLADIIRDNLEQKRKTINKKGDEK